MEIRLKQNTKAKDISDLADGIYYRKYPRSELLFPPNTSLFVDKVVPPETPDGIFTIFLTEI